MRYLLILLFMFCLFCSISYAEEGCKLKGVWSGGVVIVNGCVESEPIELFLEAKIRKSKKDVVIKISNSEVGLVGMLKGKEIEGKLNLSGSITLDGCKIEILAKGVIVQDDYFCNIDLCLVGKDCEGEIYSGNGLIYKQHTEIPNPNPSPTPE